MNREYQVIEVDQAYRIRDNQFWYTDCRFADLIRNKASIVINIDGLGIRTLIHSAPGKDGRPTLSYKLPSSADRQWWKTHNGEYFRLELLRIEAEEEVEPKPEPVRKIGPYITPETILISDIVSHELQNISDGVLCIGLDIAWFGGSENDKDSQFDCIGAAFISPHVEQPIFTLIRVPLKDRDPNAVQLLKAINGLLQKYQGIKRVIFALDAPIQAVDRGLPVRSPNPSKGEVERRACENCLDKNRKNIERSVIGNNGWRPNIQPGAPLAPRVVSLLNGLQKLGFSLWTRESQNAEKIVIECFPAEAIWAIRQLGYYPKSADPAYVKAYKNQKGIPLSADQVESLIHRVLDDFTKVTGSTAHWSILVDQTINQMLKEPTWKVNGCYRGGKYLDDAVDTMICLATSLSYAYHLAHVWQDRQNVCDGHIIGPGFSNDGKWTAACTD